MRPLALAALLAASCSAPATSAVDAALTSDGPWGATDGSCDLSTWLEVQVPGDAWRTTAATPAASLILGFQGFLMVYARLGASATPPPLPGTVTIAIDGRGPYQQSFPPPPMHAEGAELASDLFPLFFNDVSIDMLVQRQATLDLRLGRGGCGLASTGRISFVYLAGCIGDPNGGLKCPDGGAGK